MLFKLYPIVAASVSWGQEWRRKWITMFCDNEAVLAMINTKRYACATIMSLLRRLTWQSVTLNFIINAEHTPGHYNVLADSLVSVSRNSDAYAPQRIRTQYSAHPSTNSGWVRQQFKFAVGLR